MAQCSINTGAAADSRRKEDNKPKTGLLNTEKQSKGELSVSSIPIPQTFSHQVLPKKTFGFSNIF